MLKPADTPLTISACGGVLSITVGHNVLVHATRPENGGRLRGGRVDGRRAGEWADAVAFEMARLREDGTSLLDLLFDAAMQQAADRGSVAVKKTKKMRWAIPK